MTDYVVVLPWTGPPLSLNDRGNWRSKARQTAQVRSATGWAVKAARVPFLSRCEVLLTYYPRDRRRRDADNLVATLKVCADAMVDAGVCLDDTPDLMVKKMPVIGPVVKGGRLTLTITPLPPLPADVGLCPAGPHCAYQSPHLAHPTTGRTHP